MAALLWAGAELAAAVAGLMLVTMLSPARADLPAAPLDLAMEAVLVVHGADAEDRFLGSAFLWGDGAAVAVTNAHVVGDRAEVRLIDRRGLAVVVPVIARDPVRDIAVLDLRGGLRGRAGLMAAGGQPAPGTPVWAMGAPLGTPFTLTAGVVSAAPRQVEPQVPLRLLQHDAAVNPGSSGGPLVDAQGRLLGMNARIADGSRLFVGIAYAIPAADLARLVPALLAGTLAPVPELGLRLRPVDRQVAQALGVAPQGLLVDEVGAGGLAARAGLRPGDVILSLDGATVGGEGEGALAYLIEAAVPRGTATIAVSRGGAALILTLDMTPGASSTRRVSDGGPIRVAAYRLAALGLELGAGGRLATINRNSPAAWAGMAEGDTILAVNGHALDLAALRALELTAPALVLLRGAGGQSRHVILDPWADAQALRPMGGANVLDPAVVVF